MALGVKIDSNNFIIEDLDTKVKLVQEPLAVATEVFSVSEFTYQEIKVAASQTDFAINFGGVSPNAKRIFMKSNKELSVKLNSSGNSSFKLNGTFFSSGDIASIFVTTALEEVTLKVIVAA